MPPTSIADIGHGTNVEFLTSNRTFEVKSIKKDGPSRATFDATHLRTQNIDGSVNTYRERKESRVIEPGTVGLVCHFDGRMTTPALLPREAVRITYPVPEALTNGKKEEFTALVVEAPNDVEIEGVMMWQLKLQIMGAVVETPAS